MEEMTNKSDTIQNSYFDTSFVVNILGVVVDYIFDDICGYEDLVVNSIVERSDLF